MNTLWLGAIAWALWSRFTGWLRAVDENLADLED